VTPTTFSPKEEIIFAELAAIPLLLLPLRTSTDTFCGVCNVRGAVIAEGLLGRCIGPTFTIMLRDGL